MTPRRKRSLSCRSMHLLTELAAVALLVAHLEHES
jgi:hypothetical protein